MHTLKTLCALVLCNYKSDFRPLGLGFLGLLVVIEAPALASLPYIIPDYTALNRTQYTVTSMQQKSDAILTVLNENPEDMDSLYQYLATVESMEEVCILAEVGERLLNIKPGVHNPKLKAMHFSGELVEERSFHILNFVYLTKPNISPWLRYHYAFSIVAFPHVAAEKFSHNEPIDFALHIFSQWDEHMKSELYAQEVHFGEKQDIPMNRLNLSQKIERYHKAFDRFYALLSQQTTFCSYSIERPPKDLPAPEHEQNTKQLERFRNQMLKGLQKYNKEATPMKETIDPWKWIEGPCYFALGVAATTALSLASKSMGQTIHH